MAKNNEGYLNQNDLSNFTGNLVLDNKDNDKSIEVDVLATSELLEKYEVDGQIYEEISVTQFALIDEDDLNISKRNNLNIKNGGNVITPFASDVDEFSDPSISVKIVSTNSYIQSGDCLDLTKVSGYWTIMDRTVSVGTKRVNYGQVGKRCDNGAYIGSKQTSGNLYPGSLSYSYTVPSSWIPVNQNADSTEIGHTSTAELTRGSSKWTMQFQNKIVLY